MQIQAISNSQPHTPYFQGNVKQIGLFCPNSKQIILPLMPRLKSLMAKKNFNLFIKETQEGKDLEFIAKRGARKISALLQTDANNLEDLHYSVAQYAVSEYEKLPKKTLKSRFQNMIFKLFDKD